MKGLNILLKLSGVVNRGQCSVDSMGTQKFQNYCQCCILNLTSLIGSYALITIWLYRALLPSITPKSLFL